MADPTTASDYQGIREEANRLNGIGLKLITVIPVELPAAEYPHKDDPNKPAYTGKNPSRWQNNGEPFLLSHRRPLTIERVHEAVATAERLEKPIGLAIVPNNDVVVIDFDLKDYGGDRGALVNDVKRLLEEHQELRQTRIEKTPGGGIHIYLRVADGMASWSNGCGGHRCRFTTTEGGPHRGEVLSGVSISVTAPTRNGRGAYELKYPNHAYKLVEVPNLAAVGITPHAKQKAQPQPGAKPITSNGLADLRQPAPAEEVGTSGEIRPPQLRDLIRSNAKAVLNGQRPYGSRPEDRSSQLAGFLRELHGCRNFLEAEGLPYAGTVDELVSVAVTALGIEDKDDRVADTIEASSCTWLDREKGLARYQRLDGGGAAHAGNSSRTEAPESKAPVDSERPPATWRELMAQALDAVRRGDDDAEMTVRAEIMGRFKRTDAQITQALFKDLTKAEGGGITQAAYREVELDQLDPMEWLLEGFIPANDITLLYGEGGAGKTTATLAMAFALINGKGFLDRESPAPRSRVLFIASDSGGTPLKTALHTLGLADHPALAAGDARRFHVWAHDAGQGAMAWDASLAGCLALLEVVKTQGFDLVVIDSCKAVTAKADLSYTDNGQVTALLTFIKEVICRHCAVVLINHDGTAKGQTAGAKAWKEIPSMVHSIELVQGADPKGKVQADDPRSWVVKKSRFPGVTREFRYSLDQETGQLQLDHMAEKVKDCRAAITEVLTQACQEGAASLSRKVIVDRCWEHWRYSRKSVDNSLSWMAGSKHPEVVRVPSLRGHYRLSPRMIQTLSP